MDKMQESINKDIEELKSTHTETNNTVTEIKNRRNQQQNYLKQNKSVSWKIKWWK